MKSITQQIRSLEGLLGTDAIGEWETQFIENIVRRTDSGRFTRILTEKQIDKIDQIHRDHFGG